MSTITFTNERFEYMRVTIDRTWTKQEKLAVVHRTANEISAVCIYSYEPTNERAEGKIVRTLRVKYERFY